MIVSISTSIWQYMGCNPLPRYVCTGGYDLAPKMGDRWLALATDMFGKTPNSKTPPIASHDCFSFSHDMCCQETECFNVVSRPSLKNWSSFSHWNSHRLHGIQPISEDKPDFHGCEHGSVPRGSPADWDPWEGVSSARPAAWQQTRWGEFMVV